MEFVCFGEEIVVNKYNMVVLLVEKLVVVGIIIEEVCEVEWLFEDVVRIWVY